VLVRSLILLGLAFGLVLASSGDAVALSCADDYSETATLELESVTVDGKPAGPSAGHSLGSVRVYPRRDRTVSFEVVNKSDRDWEEAFAP
jgi:hypothetical protein